MDTKTFARLLRKIVKEEVTKVVRSEMRALLNENTVNHSKTIKHGMRLHDMVDEANTFSKKPKSAPKRKFSNNDMLNDLLNETGPLSENTSWNSMNFSSQMAQAYAPTQSQPMVAPPVDLDGRPVNTDNEQVASVVNAMTKDYSALMKAIDKKKGK